MSASACYTLGEITCASCHSMHDSDPNDQLARDRVGDEACLQCHTQYVGRISEHTHHEEDSPGSRCYNCHMPNTTYGILQLTRSHRIDIPTAEGTATTGRPNACNLCHLDQTLEWADSRIASWYDKPKAAFDEDGRTVPTGALWLLKGDAVDRATVSWHLGMGPGNRGVKSQYPAAAVGARSGRSVCRRSLSRGAIPSQVQCIQRHRIRFHKTGADAGGCRANCAGNRSSSGERAARASRRRADRTFAARARQFSAGHS